MSAGEYLAAALLAPVAYAWLGLVACRIRWGMGRQVQPRNGLASFLIGQLVGTLVTLAFVTMAILIVVPR